MTTLRRLMKWLKLFYETRTDPKLWTLTGDKFRVFVNLLLFVAEKGTGGTLEVDSDHYLAVEVARGDVALLLETLDALQALHVIETRVSCVTKRYSSVTGVSSEVCGRHLAFPNYEKRQKKVVKARSASSTERVRKYREKQRLAAIANGQAEVPEESREPMKHETIGNSVSSSVSAPLRIKREELRDSLPPSPPQRFESDPETLPTESGPEPQADPEPDAPPPPSAESVPAPEPVPPPEEPVASPNLRTPEDQADVKAALDLLSAHPNTVWCAQRIGQEHNTAGNIGLPGWKWLVAASKLAMGQIKPENRKKWPYFMGVVRNASADELAEIRDQFHPAATSNGTCPPARAAPHRKPTDEEKQATWQEGKKRTVAKIPDDMQI
jgi:hypothetical protein